MHNKPANSGIVPITLAHHSEGVRVHLPSVSPEIGIRPGRLVELMKVLNLRSLRIIESVGAEGDGSEKTYFSVDTTSPVPPSLPFKMKPLARNEATLHCSVRDLDDDITVAAGQLDARLRIAFKKECAALLWPQFDDAFVQILAGALYIAVNGKSFSADHMVVAKTLGFMVGANCFFPPVLGASLATEEHPSTKFPQVSPLSIGGIQFDRALIGLGLCATRKLVSPLR